MDRQTTGRNAALAIAIGLVALLLHNVGWFVRNQLTLRGEQRFRSRPRALEPFARVSGHAQVTDRLANYYLFEQLLAGTTFEVPPSWAEHRWYLEKLSRVTVRVAPGPLVVPTSAEAALRDGVVERSWLESGTLRTGWVSQKLYVRVEPPARDYVVAESADGDSVYVVPARYLTP